MLVIDASVEEAALARSLETLLKSPPADGKRMIGAVVHDSVVRFVVPLLPDPNIDREVLTVLRMAKEIGVDPHTNFAVAIERATALFADIGEQSGRRQVIVIGKGVIDTGDAKLDEQYRQWLEAVLLPGLTDLGIEIRMQATPAEATQAGMEEQAGVKEKAPSPSAPESAELAAPAAEDGENGDRVWMAVAVIVALVAVAILLFLWIRRRQAGADEAPAATSAAAAPDEGGASEKTIVRPAVPTEATATTQVRGETVSDGTATDVTATTQIRPDQN